MRPTTLSLGLIIVTLNIGFSSENLAELANLKPPSPILKLLSPSGNFEKPITLKDPHPALLRYGLKKGDVLIKTTTPFRKLKSKFNKEKAKSNSNEPLFFKVTRSGNTFNLVLENP